MDLKGLTKDQTILIHPASYKKNKHKLDKIGCRAITANFVKQDKITIWKDNGMKICQK